MRRTVVERYQRANWLLDRAKVRREAVRQELLEEAERIQSTKPYLLPSKSIFLPQKYLSATGHTPEVFMGIRYPNWTLTSTTSMDDGILITMKKKTSAAGYSVQEDGISVSVGSSEATPQVDWQTLSQEHPEVMDRISNTVVNYELDEEKFNREAADNPELPEILSRHIISKTPVLRVTAKKKT